MKTIITIEDGKVTVQVDDGQTAVVEQPQPNPLPPTTCNPEPEDEPARPAKTDEALPIAPPTAALEVEEDRPAQAPEPKPPTIVTKRTVLPPASGLTSRNFKSRNCTNCGRPFIPTGGRQSLCGDCRANLSKVKTPSPPLKELSDTSSTYESDESQQWCVHCQAFTDHQAPDHPDDLPVVDSKSKSEGFKPADTRPAVQVTSESGKFLNPWSCQNCLNLGRLCPLHKYMTNNGQKPPLTSLF